MIYRSSYNTIEKDIVHEQMEAICYIESKAALCDTLLSDESVLFEASDGKSIFAKIGEAILSIVKKCGDFIEKILEKVMGVSLSGKSELAKTEKILKRHPEFKNEILLALNEGILDLRDIQNVRELDEVASEIVYMVKMGNIKPEDQNKIKTKWARAMHKFKKAMEDGRARNVVTTVTAAGGAIGGLILFKNKAEKLKEEVRQLKSKNDEREKTLKEILSKLEKIDTSVEDMKTDNQMNMAQVAGSLRALKDVVNQSSQNVMGVLTSTMKRFNRGLGKLTAINKKLSEMAEENKTTLSRMETKAGRASKK